MHYRLNICVLLVFLLPAAAYAWTSSDIKGLLKEMEMAYEGVKDYQAHVEMRTQKRDGSLVTKKVLYTFKKPSWIRLDFESPHRGMIAIYPDRNGKVAIRPSGLTRFFKLRLAPHNSLLKVSQGQRLDQTDLGLLIRNIGHSLTGWRRGQVVFAEGDEHILIRVLADDHFREGIVTLYQFLIDRKLWLPVQVEETTPDGILKRRVIFENLKVNIGIPDSFFELKGK